MAAIEPIARHHSAEVWHDGRIGAGLDWYEAITTAMQKASISVCLVTGNYLRSEFCMREELSSLFQQRQGRDVRASASDRALRLESQAGVELDPDVARRRKGSHATHHGDEERFFVGVADYLANLVNGSFDVQVPARSRWPKPDKEDISRLHVSDRRLFGREENISMLNDAWRNPQARIVVLTADGGMGKPFSLPNGFEE